MPHPIILEFISCIYIDCCSPARPAHKAAAGEEDDVGQEADQDHHHRPHQEPGAQCGATIRQDDAQRCHENIFICILFYDVMLCNAKKLCKAKIKHYAILQTYYAKQRL